MAFVRAVAVQLDQQKRKADSEAAAAAATEEAAAEQKRLEPSEEVAAAAEEVVSKVCRVNSFTLEWSAEQRDQIYSIQSYIIVCYMVILWQIGTECKFAFIDVVQAL